MFAPEPTMSTRSFIARALAPTSFALALLAPGVASAQYIDLPGTQPNGLGDGAPLDDARSCGITCHYSRDNTTLSPMPYDTWIGSMMGNTLRDPLFLAALTVAQQDTPDIGDWCLRCHTPPGFVGGRTRRMPVAASARGADLNASDKEGVSCDSCHRMVETTNIGNGQYNFSLTETRFGPYATIDSIRHPGAVSTYLPDSRSCAACHEIANPTQPQRAADGTDTGRRFPLDTTYSEWSRSAYAVAGSADFASCVDCHMPRMGMPGFVSTNMSAVRRDNPRRHDMAGSNAWGMRVLATMRNEVASGEFYDPDVIPLYEAGARRAEAMMRTAVTVEIREAPTMARAGDRINLVARITNRSGHRVPTGYGDGRRMWLEVAFVEADGFETVVSGAYDTATAHLDTADTQIKIYEQRPGRAGMGPSTHVALHNTILSDTRLPPKGYRPLPGHEPVGVDYSGGADGALRHWDDASYMVTVPTTVNGAVRLRVRARFQVTTREYVEALAAANTTDDRGRELVRLYNATGRAAPMNMAEATAMLTVTGGMPRPDAGSDAGADASADVPSDAPRTDVPVTDVPVTDMPVTDVPVTDVPVTDAPVTDGGTTDTGPTPGDTSGGGCDCTVTSRASAPGSTALFAVGLAALTRALGARRNRKRN